MRMSLPAAPLIAAALLALPFSAGAQTPAPKAPPAAPAIDPAAKAAAEQLLTLMDYDKNMRDGVAKSASFMRSGAVMGRQVDANPALKMQRAKNPQAWDAALKKVGGMQADVIQQTVAEMGPQIHADAVDTYARAFTAAELKQMIELYKTPFGRKLIDKLPAVATISVRRAQAQIDERMAPRMRALQPAIQKEMAPLLPKPAKK